MNQLISGRTAMNEFLEALPVIVATDLFLYIGMYCYRRFRSPLWWLAHRDVTRLRKKRHALLMDRRAIRNTARLARALGVAGFTGSKELHP
jgi:hypothetical protein